MEYARLKAFSNAARELNFTKAAQLTHVTQATLSRQIQSLEEEIGVPLFVRTRHGVQLTAAGKYLYDRVISHMEQYRDIVTGCRLAHLTPFSKLRIAVGPYEHLLIYPVLRELSARYPNAQFNYMSFTYGILASRHRNKSIDFSFTIDRCAEVAEGLRSTVIYDEPWQVVAHREHPFWSLPREEQRTLKDQRIVVSYNNASDPVNPYCIKYDLHPAEFLEANFLEPQLLTLCTQECIAILPPFLREVLPEDLRMEDVLDPPFRTRFVASYDPQNINEGCGILFDICRECFGRE